MKKINPTYWQNIPDILLLELTEKQLFLVEQLNNGYSLWEIAKNNNLDYQNSRNIYQRILKILNKFGYSFSFDATEFVPYGQELIGQSTLAKDNHGNPIWIKTKKLSEDSKKRDLIKEISEYVEKINPWPAVKSPSKLNSNLLSCYVITDYHIGAYSWHEETGEDWDINIAEKVLQNAMNDLINQSPDAHTGIFCQLGDFLHWDGLLSVTPMAKNVLDADGRYEKLTRLAVQSCIQAIELLLKKHKEVHVIMAEGNHDLASSVWLRLMMNKIFKNNKRVTVSDSAFPYYPYLWGDVFLGFHHGHLSKIKQMPGKFFSEFGALIGPAKYRYLHTGHFHVKEVIETSGVITERHPTLNARDAYGARNFDKSIRSAQVITYHKLHGEINRSTVYPRVA